MIVPDKQEKIKDWFDKTYSLRGQSYLRPKEAYQILINHLKPQSGKFLDVACGLGRLVSCLEGTKLEAFGVDISGVAVQKAKKAVPFADIRQGNAENLPFKNNSFDYVSCIGSLERMIHLDNALNEQKRVAKSNARFCYMVRNSENFTWRLKTILGLKNTKGHQGAKSLVEWKSLFEKHHFEIINIYPDQWALHRLLQFLSFGILKPMATRKFSTFIPLKYAHEFIIVLNMKINE